MRVERKGGEAYKGRNRHNSGLRQQQMMQRCNEETKPNIATVFFKTAEGIECMGMNKMRERKGQCSNKKIKVIRSYRTLKVRQYTH